ncbi:MAG: glycosyltransferase [Phycisphaerales bacterium]|nr:glycosyltransferase [Phycisphaerales bacterium]
MKILHFMANMRVEKGGVVKAATDLCAMASGEHEVELITLDPSGVPEHWCNDDPSTPRVTKIHDELGFGGSLNKEQKNQIRECVQEADVVHLHAMWDPANAQVARICRSLNKPYVLTAHGMLDDWAMAIKRPKKLIYLKTWGRNLLRDASLVHCTAESELEQSTPWFDAQKGRAIPLPCDFGAYQDLPDKQLAYEAFDKLEHDLPKVLFLSRIHHGKGVEKLIQASSLLVKKGIQHQLLIAGTGGESYVQEMKTQAENSGANDCIHFLGFASGEEKIALLSACDVFTLPTDHENFGIVLFEAMASGTFVVTTNGAATWPEIEESGGGMIIKNTTESFAKTIEKVLADSSAYQEKASAGRAWVLDRMAMDKVREKYNAVYKEACDSNPGAGPK